MRNPAQGDKKNQLNLERRVGGGGGSVDYQVGSYESQFVNLNPLE